MKRKLFEERGQALILIAFGAIALFAIAGLAIDGSHKYSDRRHAQNAADTAALAGALALARGEAQWELNALDRAMDNGYDNVFPSNTVEVHNPPVSGIYADCGDVHFDCNDYVQVIITSNRATWFMRVIGIQSFTNIVQAVASKIDANPGFNFGGNAVVALNPTGCNALQIGGNSYVKVIGGGIYSNSDCLSTSFHQMGNCSPIDPDDPLYPLQVLDAEGDDPGTITSVGGQQLSCPSATVATYAVGAKQYPWPPPYQEIAEPVECSTPGGRTSNSTTTFLTPGYFAKIPGSGNSWKNTIVLSPGVYCIGSTLKINNNQKLIANSLTAVPTDPGVLLYFKPGGSFDISGGGEVHIWGINQANVDADSSLLPYKGFLIYAAPNYASGTPVGCTINGNSSSLFVGTIYAPYCKITMDGASSETGFQSQVIGWEVTFAGGAKIYLNYDGTSSPVWPIPLQVGLSK